MTTTAATRVAFTWVNCIPCSRGNRWVVLFQRAGDTAFVMGKNHDYTVVGGTLRTVCRRCGNPSIVNLDMQE